MVDEEEKKKRLERAKQIASSVNSSNSNFNNIALGNIKGNTEAEKSYIDKFQRAREITNSINPRENISIPTISEEEKIQSQQNTQKFIDLIDNTAENENLSPKKDTIIQQNKIQKETKKTNQTKTKKELDKQIAQTNIQTVTPQINKANNISKFEIASLEETQNAQELSIANIKGMEEAKQKNENIKKGGVDAFNEWANSILNNIFGGAKQAVAGLANVVTTLTSLGIRGLESTSRIIGLDNTANSLQEMYNDTINAGNYINEKATYEKVVNSQVENNAIKISGDVSNVISNMLSNMAIGYVFGISGSVAQGLSVGGSSAQEVLDENKDNIKEATLTGIAKGYTSFLTEKMFDANILTRGTKRTSIQEGINKLISKKINSKFGKEVANRTIGIIGENLEELAEDNAGYLIDKLINNKELPNFENWWNNTTETAKTTTISTIIMGLLGMGGESFSDIEMDMQTEYWIDQAQQIIEQEDLAIHFNSNEVKTTDTMQEFYITKFAQDGELANIIPTKGKEIYNPRKELNITPVVIRDSQTKYYTLIDGNTGVVLDSTPYATIMEAEGSFNEKANKLTDLQVKDINNKISKANYTITNNVISMIREAQNQLNRSSSVDYNINTTSSNENNIENIATNNNTQTIVEPNTSNFYDNIANYAVTDIKKITEPFNAQQEYTKEEMADIWNDKIVANEYDVKYDSNGNIESYIAIEEQGYEGKYFGNHNANTLVVNQYDNNDNIIKSEVIPVENGKYNAEIIKNTLEKVSSLYDENKPINGQIDIEGNEVKNKTQLSQNDKITHLRTFETEIDKYKKDSKQKNIIKNNVLEINNNILEGISKKKQSSFMNEFLKFEVKSHDYYVDNAKIIANGITIGKLKNSRTNFDQRIEKSIMNELKANVIANIDNIIKISKIYQSNLLDTKNHTFADYFDRRKSVFKYNEHFYEVMFEIGKKDGINTLYSIEKIKKTSSPTQINKDLRNTQKGMRVY